MRLNLMRPIDRVRAIQQIIGEMASSMDFEDVREFFSSMGVQSKKLSGSYSVETLARAYVENCTEGQLFEIAEQLGLDHPRKEMRPEFSDSKYWLIDHLRLFISHVHTSKLLQATYG